MIIISPIDARTTVASYTTENHSFSLRMLHTIYETNFNDNDSTHTAVLQGRDLPCT